MEDDLRLAVKGLSDDVAQNLGVAVAEVVRQLEAIEPGLDLRRMHEIVVAVDYGAELEALGTCCASGRSPSYTNEDYALGLGQVLTLPDGDGAVILPVLDARLVVSLLDVLDENLSPEFGLSLHLLHHELCHVHDMNRFIDAFGDHLWTLAYSGKDAIIRPLARTCWDEYAANRRCVASLPQDFLASMTESLQEGIGRTKRLVNEAILDYRFHSDIDVLLAEFDHHGKFLPKAAAYVLGYMDGLNVSLAEMCPDADQTLSGSYFEATFQSMQTALRRVWALPAQDWKSLSMFDELASVIDEYYCTMGLEIEALDSGELYVGVPFRPETRPGL